MGFDVNTYAHCQWWRRPKLNAESLPDNYFFLLERMSKKVSEINNMLSGGLTILYYVSTEFLFFCVSGQNWPNI